ncbi:MAG: hypothetical protein C4293_11700 [Nitrospiraceae bacterium]
MRELLFESAPQKTNLPDKLTRCFGAIKSKTGALLMVLTLGLAIAVFVSDLLIPPGVADDILYLAPVAWIALWSSPKESFLVVLIAGICTVISLAAFFLAPPRRFSG